MVTSVERLKDVYSWNVPAGRDETLYCNMPKIQPRINVASKHKIIVHPMYISNKL